MIILIRCSVLCVFQQVPQQAPVSHPEPVQPAPFSSPLQDGANPGAATTVANLDNSNPCQLALQAQTQAQSQVQSQISVLQPSDSLRASPGSASSSLTQQKHPSTLMGAAETNTEVWTHDSIPCFIVPTTCFLLKIYQCNHTQYHKSPSVTWSKNLILINFTLYYLLILLGSSHRETHWRTELWQVQGQVSDWTSNKCIFVKLKLISRGRFCLNEFNIVFNSFLDVSYLRPQPLEVSIVLQ